MRIEAWVHFDEPDEKKDLIEIMKNNPNKLLANMAIQERFGLSLTEADTVIEMYNKRIKK